MVKFFGFLAVHVSCLLWLPVPRSGDALERGQPGRAESPMQELNRNERNGRNERLPGSDYDLSLNCNPVDIGRYSELRHVLCLHLGENITQVPIMANVSTPLRHEACLVDCRRYD